MRRRGFLAALLGAPAVGSQIVQSAAVGAGQQSTATVASDVLKEQPHDPIRDAMHKYIRARQNRITYTNEADVPVKFRGKKSWSPAMRLHYANADAKAGRDALDSFHSGDMSQVEMLQILRKAGMWE